MKIKLALFAIIGLLLTLSNNLFAQCAMCKASLENNVSNGDIGYAARLNFGILYLFFLPYLLVFTLGILWYIKSRKNKQKSFLAQQRRKRFSHLRL